MGLVVPGLTLPAEKDTFHQLTSHLVGYHDGWNGSTVSLIETAYPREDYATDSYRLVRMGTDLCFRCGTRKAARALSAAGHDVYLYDFGWHFETYKDPTSGKCNANNQLGCGVYHASELRFVFDNYMFPFNKKVSDTQETDEFLLRHDGFVLKVMISY